LYNLTEKIAHKLKRNTRYAYALTTPRNTTVKHKGFRGA